MSDNTHTLTFELKEEEPEVSLHDFISREVNPLLDGGWSVLSLRITPASVEKQRSPRVEVVLRPGIWATPEMARAS